MTYAFRSASTQGNASGGALTVTKPTATADGDLIVVLAYLETDTNTWSSVGAGFTSAGSFVNTGAFKMQVWWKIASSEPSSWTWTPASSAWRAVAAASYTGVTGSGATRVDVFGTSAQGDSVANITVPSVTTTVAHDLLLAVGGNFGGGTWTESGAAATERVDFGGIVIADALDRALGATGTTLLTAGTNTYAAAHVAFFLDTGGGGTDHPVAISATATGTASVRRGVAKAFAPTASGTTTLARATGKGFAATASGTPTLARVAGRVLALAATATGTATLARQFGRVLALVATTTGTASVGKATAKALALATTGTTTLTKGATKGLAAIVAGTPALVRAIAKVLAASASGAASLALQGGRGVVLTATATGTAALARGTSKVIATTATGVAIVRRGAGKGLTAVATGAASIRKGLAKLLAAGAAGLASLATLAGGSGGGPIAGTLVTLTLVAPTSATLALGDLALADLTLDAAPTVDLTLAGTPAATLTTG